MHKYHDDDDGLWKLLKLFPAFSWLSGYQLERKRFPQVINSRAMSLNDVRTDRLRPDDAGLSTGSG